MNGGESNIIIFKKIEKNLWVGWIDWIDLFIHSSEFVVRLFYEEVAAVKMNVEIVLYLYRKGDKS